MSSQQRLKYFWTPNSDISIDDYLKKTRPSLISSNDAPWIWISGDKGRPLDPESDEKLHPQVIVKGSEIVDDLLERIRKIDNDDSIPQRSKKGVKGKKAVRDEAHTDATEKLKQLSIESGCTCGKWLLFPRHEEVDQTWSSLARSVAQGTLKNAGINIAKVATTPTFSSDESSRPHLICIYMDNIYNLDAVRKILTILLTEHGLEPSAAKSDLYTLLDIDSNHPSKLRSTIWRPSEVIEGGSDAVKALKAQYQPGIRGSHIDTEKIEMPQESALAMNFIESDSEDERIYVGVLGDKRATHKRKASSLEPSEATDNKDERKTVAKRPVRSKYSKSAAAMYKENDIFAGSDDD